MPEARLARTRRNQPWVNAPKLNEPKIRLGRLYGVVDPATGREVPVSRDAFKGHGVLEEERCPRCNGPSLSGGICLSCLKGSPEEPTAETPWGV